MVEVGRSCDRLVWQSYLLMSMLLTMVFKIDLYAALNHIVFLNVFFPPFSSLFSPGKLVLIDVFLLPN